MKKFGFLVRALLCAAILTSPYLAFARVTGAGSTDRDVFCSGNGADEVCFDKDGNVLPTTDQGGDLGTSSLRFGTIYTMDATLGDALSVTGDTTLGAREIHTRTQIGSQTGFGGIFVSTTIPYTSSYQVLLGSGTNDTVLTSLPQISTSTALNGTTLLTSGSYLLLTSTSANGVVFCDEGTCAGSMLQLGAATRTVDQYDTLQLVYDAVDGFWREVSFTAN